MSRKPVTLPKDRSAWSFGELLHWHLFVRGSRPQISPAKRLGNQWTYKEAQEALGHASDNTLRYWVKNSHLPLYTIDIERILFGKGRRFDEWRIELSEKLAEQRAKNARAEDRKHHSESSALDEDETNLNQSQSSSNPPEDSSEETANENEAREPFPDEDPSPRHEEQASEPEEENAARPSRHVPAHHVTFAWPSGPRFRISTFVTGLTILLGALTILRFHATELPRPKPVVAEKPKEPEKKIVLAPPAVVIPPPAPAAVAPVVTKPAEPAPVAPSPKPEPTEEQQREAETRRIMNEEFKARQAAFARQQEEIRQEAIRRDEETQRKAKTQRDREADASNIAGLGFKTREYTSIAGQSIGYDITANVADCALSCLRANCDGYSYFHEQPITELRRGRYCYRFKGPLSFSAHGGYTSGERVTNVPTAQAQPSVSSPAFPGARYAQASPAPVNESDGVTNCPTGPVKVTGFKLTCDAILGGGTAPGGQERFAVSNINDCAAKCRPNTRCVGFTFNPNERACQIFGATPQPRESAGWISGSR